jgi:hypothetical protein
MKTKTAARLIPGDKLLLKDCADDVHTRTVIRVADGAVYYHSTWSNQEECEGVENLRLHPDTRARLHAQPAADVLTVLDCPYLVKGDIAHWQGKEYRFVCMSHVHGQPAWDRVGNELSPLCPQILTMPDITLPPATRAAIEARKAAAARKADMAECSAKVSAALATAQLPPPSKAAADAPLAVGDDVETLDWPRGRDGYAIQHTFPIGTRGKITGDTGYEQERFKVEANDDHWYYPAASLRRVAAATATPPAAPPASRDDWQLCYVEGGYAYFVPDYKKAWGDDWDDAPYEHNAGEPYGEYEKVQWTGDYMTPCTGKGNSEYSVQQINKAAIPWLRGGGVKIFPGCLLADFRRVMLAPIAPAPAEQPCAKCGGLDAYGPSCCDACKGSGKAERPATPGEKLRERLGGAAIEDWQYHGMLLAACDVPRDTALSDDLHARARERYNQAQDDMLTAMLAKLAKEPTCPT